jgi:hypothetical protein
MLTDRARTGTLLGRFPTLAEVADCADFVASDRAGAMTAAIANLTCGSLVDVSERDGRASRPALRVAGITGYDRLSAAIPGRDVRGIGATPVVVYA